MLIVRLGLGDGVLGSMPTSSFARIGVATGVELTRTRIVSSVSCGNLTGVRTAGLPAASSLIVLFLFGVRGASFDFFGIEVDNRLLIELGTGVAFGDR